MSLDDVSKPASRGAPNRCLQGGGTLEVLPSTDPDGSEVSPEDSRTRGKCRGSVERCLHGGERHPKASPSSAPARIWKRAFTRNATHDLRLCPNFHKRHRRHQPPKFRPPHHQREHRLSTAATNQAERRSPDLPNTEPPNSSTQRQATHRGRRSESTHYTERPPPHWLTTVLASTIGRRRRHGRRIWAVEPKSLKQWTAP